MQKGAEPGNDVRQQPGGGLRSFGALIAALLRAHWILLGVVAVLLLAYTLAGFFLVPRLARSQIEGFVAMPALRSSLARDRSSSGCAAT